MEGQKIWNNILSNIRLEISAGAFKTWFGGSRVLEYKKIGERYLLVIAVANNFVKEQLEARYIQKIQSVLGKQKIENIDIIFVVSEQKMKPVDNAPIFSGVAQDIIVTPKRINALNPSANFENFVVGTSNNLAYYAAQQITNDLGAIYNPFLVYGPSGVGKTHLLQAVGNVVSAKLPDAKVLYVSSEKFTNDYIESLKNKTQEAFRLKYRKADLLLVDDIQFFSGKESTQDEFFYTFSEIYLSGRQVVIASDRHPKELGQMKERLVSRFLGGMACAIGLPDMEMKIAIVRSKCQNWGLVIADEVTTFISNECRGGAREIEGVLTSLVALSKLKGSDITLELVKSAVGSKINDKPKVAISKIVDIVCKHYKISYTDIKSSSRKASTVHARQTLMYLLRSEVGLPLEEIGSLLGGRDHSTIIHGIEKISKNMAASQTKTDELLRLQALLR